MICRLSTALRSRPARRRALRRAPRKDMQPRRERPEVCESGNDFARLSRLITCIYSLLYVFPSFETHRVDLSAFVRVKGNVESAQVSTSLRNASC